MQLLKFNVNARHIACAALVLLLQGCALLRPSEKPIIQPDPPQQKTEKGLPLATNFHLVGQWQVSGAKKASGHFDWKHEPSHDHLVLMTAWLLPLAKIDRQGDRAIVTTTNGQTFNESQWLIASAEVLGAPLYIPLESLSFWIQGFFDPHMVAGKWLNYSFFEAPAGDIIGDQGGWHLVWQKSNPLNTGMVSQIKRPDQLTLQAPNMPYTLKLIVNTKESAWQR
ncbi:MAG: lipoprotein insertase outer membrane protein LolB [Pseudomonadota bacterium]